MFTKKFMLACLFLGIVVSLTACDKKTKNAITAKTADNDFRVAFYNLENLFDTVDDPKTNDDDFLPTGKMGWTSEKYDQKLDNLSKVVNLLGGDEIPEILGVCEAENRQVLEDLIKNSGSDHYGLIHQDSPDERGIDVALIYDNKKVKVKSSEFLTVSIDDDATRDILYASLTINNEDIHVFFNHWPSRYGDKTGDKRKIAAKVLRTQIDKVLAQDGNAKIVIMGDFNDAPSDESVKDVLNAQKVNNKIQANQLYNMSIPWMESGIGSHFYDKWNALDQIIVSGSMLNSKIGFSTELNNANIFNEDWMTFFDKKRNVNKPSRFISGSGKVYGGYSDHFPVYLDVIGR